MQAGVNLAEEILARKAAAAERAVPAYRKMLRERYRKRLADLRQHRFAADDDG